MSRDNQPYQCAHQHYTQHNTEQRKAVLECNISKDTAGRTGSTVKCNARKISSKFGFSVWRNVMRGAGGSSTDQIELRPWR